MEYRVGDTIEYRAFSGDLRRVNVTAKHADVKNGRPGFDAELPNGRGGGVSVWGYDSQIVRVCHTIPVAPAPRRPYQNEPGLEASRGTDSIGQ